MVRSQMTNGKMSKECWNDHLCIIWHLSNIHTAGLFLGAPNFSKTYIFYKYFQVFHNIIKNLHSPTIWLLTSNINLCWLNKASEKLILNTHIHANCNSTLLHPLGGRVLFISMAPCVHAGQLLVYDIFVSGGRPLAQWMQIDTEQLQWKMSHCYSHIWRIYSH